MVNVKNQKKVNWNLYYHLCKVDGKVHRIADFHEEKGQIII